MTWPDCLAYLEAHCNPVEPPLPAETVLYAHVLWLLAESIGAQSVLEIGVGPTCISGMTLAHSLSNRGRTTLTSIDLEPDRPSPQYREKAYALGVPWRVWYGDSLDGPVPSAGSVDLLYIDGAHDVEHAYGDTVRYLPALRAGGLLAIDDYPSFPGVVEARKRLEADGMTFVHLPHRPPDGNGRLVWQKP